MKPHSHCRLLKSCLKQAQHILLTSQCVQLTPSQARSEIRLLAAMFSLSPPLSSKVYLPTQLELDTSSMSTKDYDSFMQLIHRRSQAEPIAYLTGEQEFWSLALHVNEHTLIPRPDTETLIDSLLKYTNLKNEEKKKEKETMEKENLDIPDTISHEMPTKILDLYTGAAPLLLAALTELPNAIGVGIDISSGAIEIAQSNARRHDLDTKTSFYVNDLHDTNWKSNDTYDVVFANPPYITKEDYQELMLDVKDYEPQDALVGGGTDGLDPYRCICLMVQENRLKFVSEKSLLIMEVGQGQDEEVVKLFEKDGKMRKREVRKDYGGIARSVVMSPSVCVPSR